MNPAQAPTDLERHVSRRAAIGSRSLVVLDDLFRDHDVASLCAFLRQLPYRLNDVDRPETAHILHWKAEFPLDMVMGTPVLRQCVEVAGRLSFGRLQLHRAHANLHLYGDMQLPHTDDEGGVTAIYYANSVWEETWFGETLFYDERREPVCAVGPKPGRLAVFDADIVHRAGVPSRECFAPRISVAFKFFRG